MERSECTMSEVRICENCNHHNAINNLECEICGFDLSFVIPVDESELNTNSFTSDAINIHSDPENSDVCSLQLVSADRKIIIPITNELVIGRDGINGSYFEKSRYVSRKHAIFYVEKGETLVFDASANGTFLNDKRLPKLEKTPIHCRDRITFADITFEVENAD